VGTGTELLSTKKPGESLDLLGPLGHGFDVHKPVTEHRTPILIAGGMGVAPLLFLAERLAGRGGPKARVLIGARTAKQILCEKEFKKYSCDVTIATDDGSRGHKGLVTELLTSHLLTVNCQHPALSEKPVSPSGVLSTIYACGPKPMLQAVSGIAREHVLAAQLSLEAHMACGIGACLGCVVKTKAGYERVCKEGPVFDALDIVW
jgi:dihydroorotate dehydrogenase electron transfer subunit